MKAILLVVFLCFGLASEICFSDEPPRHPNTESPEPLNCPDMEIWDYTRWMCMPLPMAGMPMSMLMVHGNAFGAALKAEGPRGGGHFESTNMLMIDYGKSAGDHHYLNVEVMATAEKWTVPQNGYPELGQVGDYKADGQPFVDAQHPHSSPIMGLTFSDTIAFGDSKNFMNVFFAPRGASTDGPIAFMHRPTGEVNPLVPLGHHVGQDSGHISSTVIGTVFGVGGHRLELSTFNGAEPLPTEVDMPTATPNSYAGRLTIAISHRWSAMVSGAYIKNPDVNVPQIDHYTRYSASTYYTAHLSDHWTFNNAFIYGLVRNQTDDAQFGLGISLAARPDCIGNIPTIPGVTPVYPAVNSFAEEFLFDSADSKIWGRAELLQRTPYDLAIYNDIHPDSTRWITAWTIGYTHSLATWDNVELDLGASLTKLILPTDFQPYYSGNPISEAVFLQIHGMKMVNL
jgi:hypothetical protein